jgi:hypothetical protein
LTLNNDDALGLKVKKEELVNVKEDEKDQVDDPGLALVLSTMTRLYQKVLSSSSFEILNGIAADSLWSA